MGVQKSCNTWIVHACFFLNNEMQFNLPLWIDYLPIYLYNKLLIFRLIILDVSMKVLSFFQQGSRSMCILSATGVISSVTFHQTDTSGGKVTFEVLHLITLLFLWLNLLIILCQYHFEEPCTFDDCFYTWSSIVWYSFLAYQMM